MTSNHDGDTFEMRGGFVTGDDGKLYHVDSDGERHLMRRQQNLFITNIGDRTHAWAPTPSGKMEYVDSIPLVRTGQGTSQVDYPTDPAGSEPVNGAAAWVSYAVTLAAGVVVGAFLVWRWMGGAM